MKDLCLLISIIDADYEENYAGLYRGKGAGIVTVTLCGGTATKKTLDYLGLEKKRKVMVQGVLPWARAREAMGRMVSKLGLNMPGTGIAMAVPLGSVAGSFSLECLTADGDFKETEAEKMGETRYALIVAIAEKGFSEMVMDAARSKGAKGGTVVHAKGTGSEYMAKFLGVSIAQEKEMIYIAVKKSEKDQIMRAIVQQAGPSTKARAVVFSLPVDSIAGLTGLEEE